MLNSLSNSIISFIKRLFNDKRFIACIVATYLVGIIAHGFVLTNLNLSHDSLNEFFAGSAYYVWKIQLGRYIAPFYSKLTGTICIYPWSNGLIGILWIAISVYLLVNIFDIQNKLNIVLISMIFVVNKTVTSVLATYTHEFGAYMFALLLACLAAYLWKNKKGYISIVLQIVLLFLSAGIYQAYITVYLMIIIIFSLTELRNNQKIKNVLTNGLKGVVAVIIALVGYYLVFKLIMAITNIEPLSNGYNSVSNIENLISNFPVTLLNSYSIGIKEIFTPSDSTINNILFNTVNSLLITLGIIYQIISTRKELSNLILSICLILLTPLICSLMYLLSGSYHDLMGYGIYILMLLAIVILDSKYNDNSYKIVVAGLALLLTFFNTQTANALYVKKEIQDKSTYFYMTDMVSKLEECPDYRKYDSKVAIIGNFFDDYQTKELKDIDITGSYDVSGITYYDCWLSYFENVLNYPIQLVSENEALSLKDNEEVLNMPIFPTKGSIKKVNDIIVIKLEW